MSHIQTKSTLQEGRTQDYDTNLVPSAIMGDFAQMNKYVKLPPLLNHLARALRMLKVKLPLGRCCIGRMSFSRFQLNPRLNLPQHMINGTMVSINDEISVMTPWYGS